MRFMVMHRANDSIKAGEKPSAELIARMGKLVGDGFAQGHVLDGAGLKGTAGRVRLTFSAGQCQVDRGPLTGVHEPIAGVAMVKVKALDEAIAWTTRLADAMGDVEFEIGPVTEPWDIGVAPKPEGELPQRFLLLHKFGKGVEGQKLSPKASASLDNVLADMQSAGVLVSRALLEPSSQGARMEIRGGKRSVVDGPFSEAKELIAGYVVLRANSKAEVIDWAWQYAEILADIEVDIRLISEGS